MLDLPNEFRDLIPLQPKKLQTRLHDPLQGYLFLRRFHGFTPSTRSGLRHPSVKEPLEKTWFLLSTGRAITFKVLELPPAAGTNRIRICQLFEPSAAAHTKTRPVHISESIVLLAAQYRIHGFSFQHIPFTT